MHVQASSLRIIRGAEVSALTSEAKSTRYLRIAQGTMVPPISLGPRAVGFIEYEVRAIIAARIAGKDEAALKALVIDLVAARKNAA